MGSELKNINVYKITDVRNPSFDPYGQWDGAAVVEVFKNIGDSISCAGITLAGTGIVAEIDGSLMVIGSSVSGIGILIELGIDMHGNTWESFDGEKWIVSGTIEAINYGAGKLGMPLEAEAYYNAGSIGAGRGIDAMREFRGFN